MRQIYATSIYVISLSAGLIAALQTTWEERTRLKEIRVRGDSLLSGIEDSVKQPDKLRAIADRLKSQGKIEGLGHCRGDQSFGYPDRILPSTNWQLLCELTSRPGVRSVLSIGDRRIQWTRRALDSTSSALLIQDVASNKKLWIGTFLRSLVLIWVVCATLLFFITRQTRRWMRSNPRVLPPEDILKLPNLIPPGDTVAVPATRDDSWLSSLREMIGSRKVAIYANREPYIHQRKNGRIEVVRPASGLVTALEPILRYCGGMWIGHGSGTADRVTSDRNGELAVPPNRPSYRLKRIWLSREEEHGYYYGFANEGLWPLCHLAHNRPTFRLSDWEVYRSVNQRFCDETPESVFESDSVLLVQDYHFAMLPRMLRERSGAKSRVGLFWHIPWPNPEAFGICPWGKELLHGMLGANVVGFHTQYHCNNFLETCDRYLEARIDWENFSVTMGDHETLVRAFPIGIDTAPVRTLNETEIEDLKDHYGIQAEYVAVGVDRLDYTKGLVERVQSVERFLEKNPQYIGKFTLAQMGSPSRTHIPAYQLLAKNLEDAVNRINDRFGSENYEPVKLIAHHHEWDDIQYFYQLGDICMVTSLHDGMNLVAKEYVWCQDEKRGALILSKFAGASRELGEALIVNPYSIEEMADALAQALSFTTEEKARRMRAMKEKVQGHNAFHWAYDLVKALVSEVKPESAGLTSAPAGGGNPNGDSQRIQSAG